MRWKRGRRRNSGDIQDARVRRLNDDPPASGRYVLYWMQQSQREHFNHALEYAVRLANDRALPLLAVFGLTTAYPGANRRHYRFMLEGLRDTSRSLAERGIRLAVRYGDPAEVALGLSSEAAAVVCDRGYLRHQKEWRKKLAGGAGREVVEVESDVVVPVETASDKAEIGARTLRPRIHRHIDRYLVGLRRNPLAKESTGLRVDGLDLDDTERILDGIAPLPLDRASEMFTGGTRAALAVFDGFIGSGLPGYSENRNRPGTDNVSHMGMYLHFGQVSPVYLALRALASGGGTEEDLGAFLEELIVRRELACNFVNFTPDYDRYSCLPRWASASLEEHGGDRRRHVYSRRQLERAQTHDPYWNAAMLEMSATGYMHNYMRMYWGKKILEWSPDPRTAFRRALFLNNKYFIDGRDCNSYAGVSWVFGSHDRAWPAREIFGKVRYMSSGGLERKADPGAYVEKVERMVRR
jgi:deoxyribodipyrimidine photo-lyase